MRFISDIISEKRRSASVDTSDRVKPDAVEPQEDPLEAEAWGYPQERSIDPLPLDAYALAGLDGGEQAEQDAEAAFFDQAEPDTEEDAVDETEEPVAEFLVALQQDDRDFGAHDAVSAESDEDEIPDLEIFGRNDIKAFTDPFERLAKDRGQQSTVAMDPFSMDGDGEADPDIGLVVVGRAPQADVESQHGLREPVSVAVPEPSLGRGANRSGRVKTRLLGFSTGSLEQNDVFDENRSVTGNPFPVGWLVVVSELGRGASFALQDGVSKVGRGTDQTVCLNFGDNSISRDNHLSIAYDAELNKFFIGQSGKSNLVRLNNKPLLSTEELVSRDQIRLGETTLRFIALCENDFTWGAPDEKARKHA
jgi:hypothetical protein